MALDELDLGLDNGGTIHETPGGRKETEHGIIHNDGKKNIYVNIHMDLYWILGNNIYIYVYSYVNN